jgi:TolB protein
VKVPVHVTKLARGWALLIVILAAAAASTSTPAQAAFPGIAGPIAYQRIFVLESGLAGGLFVHGPRLRDHPRRLTSSASDADPAYSPSGRTIAFSGDPDPAASTRPHIYLMKAAGGGVRQLTSGPERDSNPSFSPNGKQIVFDRIETGFNHITHIFVMNVDGSHLKQLTTGRVEDSEPVFAPNGKSIVFVSTRARDSSRSGDRTDIFTMTPAGTQLRLLINGPTKDEEPDFSPDGRSIAFSSNRNRGPNIFIARADGSHLRQITHGRGDCIRGTCYTSPAWAPDGKHIAFIAQDHFSFDLEVTRPDGSGGKEFVKGNAEEESLGTETVSPAWGPAPH